MNQYVYSLCLVFSPAIIHLSPRMHVLGQLALLNVI